MKNGNLTTFLVITGLAAGCAKEPPAPSVADYMQDKIRLDAALVRCSQNRAKLKYTAECQNAREAANKLALEAEAERRKALEAQSERKRAALRRAQVAAEQARQRAEQAARQREEAAYLSQFGPVEGDGVLTVDENGDLTIAPDSAPPAPADVDTPDEGPAGVEARPADDLQSIREELERRQRDAAPR